MCAAASVAVLPTAKRYLYRLKEARRRVKQTYRSRSKRNKALAHPLSGVAPIRTVHFSISSVSIYAATSCFSIFLHLSTSLHGSSCLGVGLCVQHPGSISPSTLTARAKQSRVSTCLVTLSSPHMYLCLCILCLYLCISVSLSLHFCVPFVCLPCPQFHSLTAERPAPCWCESRAGRCPA